jgi:ElaB/YqjD/DUF883 family membrane-anchored ribosome-binding protein
MNTSSNNQTNAAGNTGTPGDQIRQTANKAVDDIQQGVEKARDSVQQTASQLGSEVQKAAERLQSSANQLPDNVEQTVTQVSTDAARSAAEARRAMRESAYTVKETAADSLLMAAQNIRREALKGGSDEVVKQAHQLARSMEKAALYLDSRTFEQIGTDATEVVKSNPWESIGLAALVGLFLGMLLSSGRRD